MANSLHLDITSEINFNMQEFAMSDQNLKQNVLDDLSWDPIVNAAHIGVTARDGVVTLTGHVKNYGEKWAAERIVSKVVGVKAIAEEIEVRFVGDNPHQDDDIAKHALSVISWDVFVPHKDIKVKVQNGWVTLSGSVQWFFQKRNAESDIRRIDGVKGVSNEITISSSAQSSDVRSQIKAALKRSAVVAGDDITVVTEGNKVTLSGEVDSYYSRTLAENAAWTAADVGQVDDRITVS
jgi:osmotically-inducible protein OsmY